MAKVTFFISW